VREQEDEADAERYGQGVWVDADEEEEDAMNQPCRGCFVDDDSEHDPVIHYCPLHAAAPALREALEILVGKIERDATIRLRELKPARAALASATQGP
jgi:hypothetical protein